MNKQPAADDCEQYPILKYSLEICTSSSEILAESQGEAWTTGNVIISRNLSEDTTYLFRLLVFNSVGVVASNTTPFCDHTLGATVHRLVPQPYIVYCGWFHILGGIEVVCATTKH